VDEQAWNELTTERALLRTSPRLAARTQAVKLAIVDALGVYELPTPSDAPAAGAGRYLNALSKRTGEGHSLRPSGAVALQNNPLKRCCG
jgi:hypothetical protein